MVKPSEVLATKAISSGRASRNAAADSRVRRSVAVTRSRPAMPPLLSAKKRAMAAVWDSRIGPSPPAAMCVTC